MNKTKKTPEMKTPEMAGKEIGSVDDAVARDAKLLLAPPMKIAVRALNSPGDGASRATKAPKKLGRPFLLRFEPALTVPCFWASFNPSAH